MCRVASDVLWGEYGSTLESTLGYFLASEIAFFYQASYIAFRSSVDADTCFEASLSSATCVIHRSVVVPRCYSQPALIQHIEPALIKFSHHGGSSKLAPVRPPLKGRPTHAGSNFP